MSILLHVFLTWLGMIVVATAGYAEEPPGFLIDKGACPFEGCNYGAWRTTESVVMHSEPREDAAVVATIPAGASVVAQTGEVHTLPSKFVVRKAKGKFQEGDVLWVYTYLGEGIFKIWFADNWYDKELGFSPYGGSSGTRCEDEVECWGELDQKLRSTWWVQVATEDGVTGWTSNTAAFVGKNMYDFPARQEATRATTAEIDQLSKALEGVQDALEQKIQFDMGTIALAFWSVYNIERASVWADVFGAPLAIIEQTISTIGALASLGKVDESAIAAANGWANFTMTALGVGKLQQVGANLQLAIDGPAYIQSVKEMYDLAGHVAKHGGQESFETIVKEAIPKTLIMRSPNLAQEENAQLFTRDLSALRTGLQRLDWEIKQNPTGITSAGAKQATDRLKELRTQLIRSAGTSIDVTVGDETISLGAIGALQNVHTALFATYAEQLSGEMIKVAVDAVKSSTGVLRIYLSFNTNTKVTDVQSTIFTLDRVAWTAVKQQYEITVRQAITEVPQTMMFALGQEFSNAWYVIEHTLGEVRSSLFVAAPIQDDDAVPEQPSPVSPAPEVNQPSPLPGQSQMRIELSKGDVLIGRITTKPLSFASSFGRMEINLADLDEFSDGTLKLRDSTVLKGRFAEGRVEVMTPRGSLIIDGQEIVALSPHQDNAEAQLPAPKLAPQPGQGTLQGRVADNFGQAVTGAKVRILGTSLTTLTALDGSYQIPYVPGNFVVRIEGEGYDPTEFPLQLAQAATFPVEDKTLVKTPPGNGVYFWGERDWVPLERCSVDQTSHDEGDFERGGKSVYKARGKRAQILAQGPASFLDATGGRSGLLLYRVQKDETIIRIERKGGFGGFMGQLSNDGPAPGALGMDKRTIGSGRPIYESALGPGTYAFVQHPGKIANLVYPADICFKFEIQAPGQARPDQAAQGHASPPAEISPISPPATPLPPGDEQSEAQLNLDRDQRRRVQTWLNALGFPTGTPDGLFGGRTREALAAFQRSVGVAADSGFLNDPQYQYLKTQGVRVLAKPTIAAIEANLVAIPAGCFQMGSPPTERGREKDEGPQHRVCLQDFKLSRYEVTIREFAAFVAATGYRTDAERNRGMDQSGCYTWSLVTNVKTEGKFDAQASWQAPNMFQQNRDDHPVSCASWNDAKAYVAWLNEIGGGGYRLPSEAEWEYAARAGTASARYWGDIADQACRHENVGDLTERHYGGKVWSFREGRHSCTDGQPDVAPVGSYRGNPWGLYDMLGNVSELTEDCLNDSYAGAPADGSAWTQGNCAERVVRGGAFSKSSNFIRAAHRDFLKPHHSYSFLGFRIAKSKVEDTAGTKTQAPSASPATPPGKPLGSSAPLDSRVGSGQRPEPNAADHSGGATSPAPARADATAEKNLNLSPAQRRQIQAWLASLGFAAGPADGVFGAGTRGSIEAWQIASGLAGSGFLNQAQLEHLRKAGDSTAAQKIYWEAIRAQGNAAVFSEFLALYPDGPYAQSARERVKKLRPASNPTQGTGQKGEKPSMRGGQGGYSSEQKRAIDAFNNL